MWLLGVLFLWLWQAKMQDQHALQPGTIVDKYKIILVLGEGGFGITYLAEDIQLGLKVVIKEYFPNEFAMRSGDSTITAKSKSMGDFAKGMQRFKEEAQTLAKFNHPSIVKILGFFEANDTAYFVMEYEEGIDLSQYLKQEKRALSQEEILSIMMPILEGLKEVHKYKYLHRDIKPGNILLRSNKSPVLIDFGASKLAIGEASKSITSMLTEGYAPLEQYSTNIKQLGPFTDLYAVGAVIYKMITGKVPPSSQTRSYEVLQDEPDLYEKLEMMRLKGYDQNFLKSIDKTLSLKAKERPQSVKELQEGIVDNAIVESEKDIPRRTTKKTKKQKWKLIAYLLGSIAIIVVAFFVLMKNNSTFKIYVYDKACDMGDSTSCDVLSFGYKHGWSGVERNMEKAIAYEEKVCKLGSAFRCVNLGDRYKNGEDVKIDPSKAVKFYKMACEEEDMESCVKVGIAYSLGEAVEEDNEKAAQYYQKACEVSDSDGCQELEKLVNNASEAKKYTVAIGDKVWQDIPDNQTNKMDWDKAVLYCENLTLGGYDDWKLPSIETLKELYSHKSKLANVSLSGYWSGVTNVDFKNIAWSVEFSYGHLFYSNKRTNDYVRCVRTRQKNMSSIENKIMKKVENKLIVKKEKSLDEYRKSTIQMANYIWQDESDNKTLGMTWSEANQYCQNLDLGGYDDWRLPSIETLQELHNYKAVLTNLSTGTYWSSTTVDVRADHAWSAYQSGSVGQNDMTHNYYVRCVRDRQ